jgi:hypothetical protein
MAWGGPSYASRPLNLPGVCLPADVDEVVPLFDDAFVAHIVENVAETIMLATLILDDFCDAVTIVFQERRTVLFGRMRVLILRLIDLERMGAVVGAFKCPFEVVETIGLSDQFIEFVPVNLMNRLCLKPCVHYVHLSCGSLPTYLPRRSRRFS